MKINRNELLNILKAVQPGLAKQEVIDQSASFVFMDKRVFTFNDELASSHPITIDIEGAVPAKPFYALLSKIKADEIEFEIRENELFFKGGKAKTGLKLEAEIKLPIEELGEPEEWIELPKDFNDAVKFCLFSASRDNTTPVLTCLHFTNSYIESSDNFRATRRFIGKSEAFESDSLVPAFAAKQLVKYEPTHYALTEGWIHFKNKDEVMFSCRLLDEIYPELDEIFEVEGATLPFPEDIKQILDRASVISEGERASITAHNNKLTINTEGEFGRFEESSRIDYKGEKIAFDIQPEFLTEILHVVDHAIVGELLKFEKKNKDKIEFVHVASLLVA